MYNLVLYQLYLVKGMTMQKTAQREADYGGIKRVWEKVRPVKSMEEHFDPEFKDIMNSLRNTDNQVRAQIMGRAVGDAEPIGGDTKSLKSILSSAQSNLEKREYMRVVADIGMFDDRMSSVAKELAKLDVKIDGVHSRFLFSDLSPNSARDELSDTYAEYLRTLKDRFKKEQEKKEAAINDYNIVIEAGLMSFFHNIGSQRGRALAAWEKRYPQRVKVLKADTKTLLSKANTLFDHTLKNLKMMASYRSNRQVDDYNDKAKRIIEEYQNFNKYFENYYDKNVRRFLEQDNLFPTEGTDSKELAQQEVQPETKSETKSEEKQPNIPAEMQGTPGAYILGDEFTYPNLPKPQYSHEAFLPSSKPTTLPPPSAPSAEPNVAPAPGQKIENPTVPMSQQEDAAMRLHKQQLLAARKRRQQLLQQQQQKQQTQPAQKEQLSVENPELRELMRGASPQPTVEYLTRKIQHKPVNIAHEQFMQSLQKMASESPIMLRSYITKYANSIKTSDPDNYKKLMAIVNSIEV